MQRRLPCTIFLLAIAATSGLAQPPSLQPPNIIHFIVDDVGYDDIACFGASTIKTPNLDALAARGIRFTNYYSPAPLCSASRAAILTGCYAERVGIPGALMPHSKIGLSQKEITMAELLKTRGYHTALVGKWHLGHTPDFSPLQHGFDHFFGLPYPNDQGAERNVLKQHANDPVRPPIPLYRGTEIIEHSADMENLPVRFLNDALNFIDQHQSEPFYLHYANIETHVPWFIPSIFQGKSQAGSYGDAIEFMDWTLGQLTAFLQSRGLDQNTLIVFSSDNGMLTKRGIDYETTYGRFGRVDDTVKHILRGSKHTVWEGGTRVACIAAWPGKVPLGNECKELCAGFDWYTTFALIAGAAIPTDRIIDGKDIRPLLFGELDAKSPHEQFYYYHSFRLGAVRQGSWKLMIEPTGKGFDVPNIPTGKPSKPQLFNLDRDLGETADLADEQPEIVKRLMELAEHAREDLGDSSQGRIGKGMHDM